MNKGLLIILSGPSGVGKGTIREKVMEDASLNLWYSVSLTTRKKRPGEVDGREYHFVSQKEFDDNIARGNLLEHARFVEHSYGTPKDAVEEHRALGQNVLLEIDVNGARQVMEKLKDDPPVSIFILPPNFEELERRIRGRCTEGENAIQGRLCRAQAELGEASFYRYEVINDSLPRCVEEIKSIIRKEIAPRG